MAQAPITMPKPEAPARPMPGTLAGPKPEPDKPDIGTPTDPKFISTVNEVLAPTVVYDANGRLVNGLQLHNFEVFDNGKPQEFKVDVAFRPIDVAVVIQADAVVEDALPRIKKMGSLLETLVAGEQGTVAVLAFDHRIRVMTDFTNDGAKIKKALDGINAGSSSARQVDAVNDAVRMLSHRGKDRRRILLLIS